ncbi:MAG: radical SAM protein [Bryobacteraceae bacterium]|nr:radical SAM protein [Bryobacteraceae bacterium]
MALHRLGLLTPSAFVLWICTWRCNFSCAFCEAGAGPPAPDELSTEEARELIDDIARIGARRLLLSGGEPLPRGDLPALLEHSLRRSVTPALLSNGFLVSSRWEEIRHFRYFPFMTSIDGPRETHDRLRRAGSFDRAMAALENFASIGVRTRVVKTIVHPANLPSLPELATCLEASAATDWQLAPVMEIGRAREKHSYRLCQRDWQFLIDFVERRGNHSQLNVEFAHPYAQVHTITGRLGPRTVFRKLGSGKSPD